MLTKPLEHMISYKITSTTKYLSELTLELKANSNHWSISSLMEIVAFPLGANVWQILCS